MDAAGAGGLLDTQPQAEKEHAVANAHEEKSRTRA